MVALSHSGWRRRVAILLDPGRLVQHVATFRTSLIHGRPGPRSVEAPSIPV